MRLPWMGLVLADFVENLVYPINNYSSSKHRADCVTSCRDSGIDWGLQREKSGSDCWLWFCCRKDGSSKATPCKAGATELNLTCHENTACYKADGLDSSSNGQACCWCDRHLDNHKQSEIWRILFSNWAAFGAPLSQKPTMLLISDQVYWYLLGISNAGTHKGESS